MSNLETRQLNEAKISKCDSDLEKIDEEIKELKEKLEAAQKVVDMFEDSKKEPLEEKMQELKNNIKMKEKAHEEVRNSKEEAENVIKGLENKPDTIETWKKRCEFRIKEKWHKKNLLMNML